MFLFAVLISCSAPADGTYTATVDQNVTYKVTDSYTYLCQADYGYAGSLVSRCQYDGEWSLAPPACVDGKL